MNKFFILLILTLNVFAFKAAYAAQPTCHSSSGGYCQYTGKVKRLYVNKSNAILMYFDTPLNVADAQSIGFNATNSPAAIFYVQDGPDFAKMLYSTLLSAQARNADITIQMRGVKSGYLMMDRIWLANE